MNVMNLFQTNKPEQTLFSQAKHGIQSGEAKKNDEPRFAEVLNSVTKKNDHKQDDSIRKINEKIDSLEKKIQAVESDPDKAKKIPADEIKKVLDKISETSEKLGSSLENTNAGETDISNIILKLNQLLEQLSQLLNISVPENEKFILGNSDSKIPDITDGRNLSVNTDKQDINKMGNKDNGVALDLLEKLNELENMLSKMLSGTGEKTDSGPSGELTAGKVNNNTTESVSQPEKVKVIDKRTDINESAVENPAEKKAVKTAFQTEQKITAADGKEIKPEIKDAALQKIMETRSEELLKMKDINALLSRTDLTQNVSGKQYASFTSSVSKTNLEALMQNITGKAVITLHDGKSEMKLNLIPPELGKINMKFTLEDGQMIGKIVVSTPEAKMLFDQNLGDLQRALQQAGVNITGLDVSLGQNQLPGDSAEPENNQTSGIRDAEFSDQPSVGEIFSGGKLYDSSINYVA